MTTLSLPPSLRDRYRPLRLLGKGGFGEVVLATDLELDRRVAVKVLRRGIAGLQVQARFEREARVTAALRHPSVVEVFDHGADGDGNAWIVYEFVPGLSLADWIDEGRERPLEQVVSWGRQVAGALDAAHRAGVVHRDVKPDNVIVRDPEGATDELRAVLCDFGIARAAGRRSVRTAHGKILGTPGYMAREVCRGGAPGPAADQYGLAATLYELAYGSPLFEPGEPMEMVQEVLKGLPPRPPEGGRELPLRLEAALLRALDPDPARRFPDMRAFGRALEGAGEAPPSGTVRVARARGTGPAATSLRSSVARSSTWEARVAELGWGRLVPPGLGLLLLVGGGIWWGMGPTRGPEAKNFEGSFAASLDPPARGADPALPAPEEVLGLPGLRELTARLLEHHHGDGGRRVSTERVFWFRLHIRSLLPGLGGGRQEQDLEQDLVASLGELEDWVRDVRALPASVRRPALEAPGVEAELLDLLLGGILHFLVDLEQVRTEVFTSGLVGEGIFGLEFLRFQARTAYSWPRLKRHVEELGAAFEPEDPGEPLVLRLLGYRLHNVLQEPFPPGGADHLFELLRESVPGSRRKWLLRSAIEIHSWMTGIEQDEQRRHLLRLWGYLEAHRGDLGGAYPEMLGYWGKEWIRRLRWYPAVMEVGDREPLELAARRLERCEADSRLRAEVAATWHHMVTGYRYGGPPSSAWLLEWASRLEPLTGPLGIAPAEWAGTTGS